MAMRAELKLAAAMLRIAEPERGLAPYFGSVLFGLLRQEVHDIPTMAVSNDGILFWNRHFVDDSTPEVLGYVLMHETLHVLYEYHDRAAAFGVKPGVDLTPELAARAELANVAEDACINEALRDIAKSRTGITLPEKWIYPETLQQPLGLVFEQRMKLLLQNPPPPQQRPGPGTGQCGSCTGQLAPGEPMPQGSGAPGSESTNGKGGKDKRLPGRSTAEIERMRFQAAAEMIEAAQKQAGSVPASLRRWAEKLQKPARIDWRTKLHAAVRRGVAYKCGSGHSTYHRVSKLQAAVGNGPGAPRLMGRERPVPRVGVIIDTSGSMGADDLGEVLVEVKALLQSVQAEVTVGVVDAAMHGIQEVDSLDKVASMLKGGGGTDMRPGFRAMERHKPRPDIVVVATDGILGGGHPAQQPTWCQSVIWVLVGPDAQRPCDWGTHVFTNERAEDRGVRA